MISSGDWFLIHRCWLDCEALYNHNARGWWATILSLCMFGESTYRGHKIRPGEFGCSLRSLAEDEGVDRNTLRGWIRHFEQHDMITIQTHGVGRSAITIIRVVNWQKYQPRKGELTNPLNSQSRDLMGELMDESMGESMGEIHTPQKKKEEERRKESARTRFKAPSIEDVRAYCQERSSPIDADLFHDHYTANGWRQGQGTGRPIKDWQAAFRNWERREINRNRTGGSSPSAYKPPTPRKRA